jgi:anti-sigma regulatory factor (Ser/Thr protein kinase)
MDAAVAANIEKADAYRLRLSVDEVVTNIVVHGYEEAGRSGDITICATIDDQALVISVEDSAIPFDPRQIPTPADLDKPLEERDIGGLGIFLAIEGVDEFQYERVNDRNRNTFIVRRKTAAPEKEI